MTTTDAAARTRVNGGIRRDVVEARIFGVLRVITIVLLVIFTVFPFLYMIVLSMKDLSALLQAPGDLFAGLGEIGLQAYVEVLTPVSGGGQGFGDFIRNSAIIAIGTVVLTLLIAIPGSYAVSRLNFPGVRSVSALFLAVYLFPATLLAIPLFIFFSRVGLRGEFIGLIIVYVSQTVAVSIYMLRNYFETVPRSLEEAAALDGAGRLRTLWSVNLPLAMPAIVANGLFVFMIAWNEFLFALLFLVDDRSRWTVSLGLSQLAGSIEIPTTVLMAGSVILTVPIVVLFFACERLLTEGLTSGAEKG